MNQNLNPQPKRNLFAVAVEITNPNTQSMKAHIVYLHAEDTTHAKNQYYVTHPNRRTHNVIGVAPVVGYFLEDGEHGKILSVS
jgi:hypothetical protein